ncbi:MAG: HAMP domain-containing histidine kinase [Pirellulales bacterium]|nr:HAMP domain-containing histidine kinase [Pirellulales bacterium]
MSAWLPLTIAGQTQPWVYLSHGAANAMLAALVSEESGDEFRATLACDPPLALWLLAVAHQRGNDALRSVAALADWALANQAAVAALEPASPAPQRAEFSGEEACRLAALSVAVARRAANTAPLIADEAYLLGLTHAARQWLYRSQAQAPRARLPLPDWWRRALVNRKTTPQSGPAQQALRQALAEIGSPPAELVESLQAHWHWPGPGPAERFAALGRYLLVARQTAAEQQARMETEKLASLAELAAGAGHEINNPLAVISGRAQLLARDERDPERRRELAGIHAQARRVHEMISDLMLFARPPWPEREPVELSKLLARLVEGLVPEAALRQIDLLSNIQGGPLVVMADPTQLLVALRAVADNALQAMAPGGRLEIDARRHEAGIVEISLQDTGPGISPEVRRHLFDPFYSGRSAGRGLGFGLSKAWRIATLHDGRLTVTSEPGQGARFSFFLPATEPLAT